MPSRSRIARCSRVCGMTPSSAATTRSAKSMPVAPASMLLTNRSWPGTSTKPRTRAVRRRHVGEAEVDGDAAGLLLLQPVGVDAGQRPDQRGLAVVDVAGGADDHGPGSGSGWSAARRARPASSSGSAASAGAQERIGELAAAGAGAQQPDEARRRGRAARRRRCAARRRASPGASASPGRRGRASTSARRRRGRARTPMALWCIMPSRVIAAALPWAAAASARRRASAGRAGRSRLRAASSSACPAPRRRRRRPPGGRARRRGAGSPATPSPRK